MSDYPKGGDIQATRLWLDKKGFIGSFSGWKADAILGLEKSDILSFVPEENGLKLWGFLNTDRTQQAAAPTATQIFVIAGIIKFGKLRCGCRQRLFRIAEEKHAKTRVGIPDDGIAYQGITKHLQFKLVFREEAQAEDFKTAVKKFSLEYRKRKLVDLPDGAIVVPDINVEFQLIQRGNWDGNLDLVEEDQHEKIKDDAELSHEYDMNAYTQSSVVSVNAETKLRMLEREDSPNLFRRKPEKCYVVRHPDIVNNPNNTIYMSSFLRMQLDAINSTEGIPQFYFRYVAHSELHQQGLWANNPIPVYETILEIVFKDEEAKNELSVYFKNPSNVNQTIIRVVAYFPDPLEFDYFAQIKAEETIARWASYDGLLNG